MLAPRGAPRRVVVTGVGAFKVLAFKLFEGGGCGSFLAGFFTLPPCFSGFSAARFPIAGLATDVTAEQWVRARKQDHSNLIGWGKTINHIQFGFN